MTNLELTSGFKQYPAKRDKFLEKNGYMWIKGLQEQNGIWPYWRIHNKLYDLTDFANRHPGGKFWIDNSKGIDITEAFEASHYTQNPQKLLQKYYVKDINTPRLSPFTFEQNGFYQTLKRKALPILNNMERGPTFQMKLIQDCLFLLFIVISLLAAIWSSFLMMIIAGVILTLSTNCAHNFFHQKDNWRMFIFDLSLLSSREWRLTHAFSHHLYSNTIHDYEIFAFEPFLELLPKSDKIKVISFLSATSLNPAYYVGFIMNYFRRWLLTMTGLIPFDECLFIQPLLAIIFVVLSGSAKVGLLLWVTLHVTFSYIFLFLTLQGAHHNNDVCHEGDIFVAEKDWGIHQIVSTAQEKGIESRKNSLLMVAIYFGDHTLHHLFPTVDHSRLNRLNGIFEETCEEFGIDVPESYPIPMISNVMSFYEHALRNKPYDTVPKKFLRMNKIQNNNTEHKSDTNHNYKSTNDEQNPK